METSQLLIRFASKYYINKREYNSERRRKPINFISFMNGKTNHIRENITPRGDGNFKVSPNNIKSNFFIRENITPRGDGNYVRNL